jgi:DNA-directed RNA polymerase specialized sigma24 family protein
VLDWISDRELVLFVDRLPLAQRQVLLLRYMLDLTHAQIAEVLDRTPDDVRALHSRALRFLRTRLAALGRDARHGTRSRAMRPVREARVLRHRRFVLLGR